MTGEQLLLIGMKSRKPIVAFFGTVDIDNGRARSVCDAMRHLGWHIEPCHLRFWRGTASKLGALRLVGLLRTLARSAVLYPRLVLRALGMRPFDVMLISTGGYLDILFGWIAARVAGAVVVFDPLYGLSETIIDDRRLLSPRGLPAWAIRTLERLCFRLADVVLVDTQEHMEYFARQVGVPRQRMIVVPVGAEDGLFHPPADARPPGSGRVNVLFYGSMIPLHGAETIIRAAHLVNDPDVGFTIVGRGQMSDRVESLARELGCDNIRFVPNVPYETVPDLIAAADICLGIFGTTQKAQDVVPTKVYQCVAMGKPVVTGDTPAVRRLFRPGEHLLTVPCGDAAALAAAVVWLKNDPPLCDRLGRAARRRYEQRFSAQALAQPLKQLEARIR